MASEQSKRRFSPEPLARWCATHRAATFLIWIAVLVAGLFLTATLLSDATTTEFNFTGDPDSKIGLELLEERLREPRGSNEVVVIQSTQGSDRRQSRVPAVYPGPVQPSGWYEVRQRRFSACSRTRNFPELLPEPSGTRFPGSTGTGPSLSCPLSWLGDFDDASDNISPMLDAVEEAHSDERFNVYMVGQASGRRRLSKAGERGTENRERYSARP